MRTGLSQSVSFAVMWVSYKLANDWIINIIKLQIAMITFISVENQLWRKQLFGMWIKYIHMLCIDAVFSVTAVREISWRFLRKHFAIITSPKGKTKTESKQLFVFITLRFSWTKPFEWTQIFILGSSHCFVSCVEIQDSACERWLTVGKQPGSGAWVTDFYYCCQLQCMLGQ